MPYTPAQQKIADCMRGKTKPTAHDLKCFVGMIETGECDGLDFLAVGGVKLRSLAFDAYDVAHTDTSAEAMPIESLGIKAATASARLVVDGLRLELKTANAVTGDVIIALAERAAVLSRDIDRLADNIKQDAKR